jgi:pyruvate dehydrogenase E2 component (dihydrolipoamide acetyltransferase)
MGMSEAVIIHWYVNEGESINQGDPLVDIESSKSSETIEAPVTGIVSQIFYQVDEEAEIGQVLAIIVEPDEAPAAVPAEPETVMPVIPEEGSSFTEQPLSPIRRRTAQRMVASLQEAAQLTLHTEVDVTATVERRELIKAETGATYTDILVKVVASELKRHPQLNAMWGETGIRMGGPINIGVAVALSEGLVVPVIRDADQLSLAEIHDTTQELAEKVRSGGFSPDDVSGGTFTITNLGMHGIDWFTPILNPPESGILGVGRIIRKPAVVDDRIVARAMMGLSLTFDHRVVDGAPAAEFLADISSDLVEARF